MFSSAPPSGSQGEPSDNDDEQPDPIFVSPLPSTVGVALGVAAGCLPPTSWGLMWQAFTAAPLSLILDAVGTAAYTSYQVGKKFEQERKKHGRDWMPPHNGSITVAVRSQMVPVAAALLVVIARAAYKQDQPKMLGELFADARSVRALEARLEVQEQAVRELQAEVAALRQERHRDDVD